MNAPTTERTWELYNSGKCGLHYVAHKMRELETENIQLRTAVVETLEGNRHLADGENCTLAKLKRAVNWT